MSKSTNIISSVLYLLFTIGVAVSSHYCMGRVSHQDMFSFDNHGCICDQLMGEDDDCCNDEVALVAFEEDQQVSSRLLHITPKLAVLFVFDLEGEFGLNATNTDQLNIAHLVDPPPKNRQPLYLIYSNYTFYG